MKPASPLPIDNPGVPDPGCSFGSGLGRTGFDYINYTRSA